MKAKYVVIGVAVALSSIFSGVYMKWFSTVNSTVKIYVCQVGIYKEQPNADEMIQNLTNLQLPTYSYTKDESIIVISDIFLNEEEAKKLGETISQHQMTCAIREFTISEELKPQVEAKDYTKVLEEIQKQ